MSNMITLSASKFFEQIKYHQNIDDNFEQPSMIRSKLRAYQRRAVKWMIERENNNDLVKSNNSPFSGGILADESGLGKTLEMLCCIAVNTSPPEFNTKKTVLENLGNLKNDTQNTSIPLLHKPSTIDEKIQNAECEHFNSLPSQLVPSICANGQIVFDKIQCKATLIVIPQLNLNQWNLEIGVHIAKPGLKVFCYYGVHVHGYMKPNIFNNYDIVIMPYECLSKDLNNGLENRSASSLRHPKKYNYPLSPLLLIKWWRICLAKGQAVESKMNKMSQIMSCLESVHKWVITGKPIQKSLYDLYGILKYLDIHPYYEYNQFLQLMESETNFVYEWFSRVIWRNSIKDVNSEFNVPKLTFEKHWLIFPEHEKYFYQHLHDVHSSLLSRLVMRSHINLNISFKDLQEESMDSITDALERVQRACINPQILHCRYSKLKDTMTMDKIIEVMLKTCRGKCNVFLNSLLSNYNFLAGMYVLSNPSLAVKNYRNVLELIEKYKDMQFEIDEYEKLHTLHNLVNIFATYEKCPSSSMKCALNDLDLKNNLDYFEKECKDKSKQKVELTRKNVQLCSDKIEKLMNGKQLSCSNWWSDVLKLILSPEEFIIEVQTELEDYHVLSDSNIANELNSINDILNILSVWLNNLNSKRIETLSLLKTLEEIPMSDLIKTAKLCHLPHRCRVIGNCSTRSWCLICKASKQLKIYESLLFCVSNEEKNKPIAEIIANIDETLYETNSVPLKISQEEFLLRKLFQYERTKMKDNYIEDAIQHMQILNLIHEEFRYLKLLWIRLYSNLFVHYNIIIAKQAVVWPWSRTLQSREDGPPRKKTKHDIRKAKSEIRAILPRIPILKVKLENQIALLSYLEKLKNKDNLSEPEPCPICILNMNASWAVLSCGHSVCFKCLVEIGVHSDSSNYITCPICRHKSHVDSIHYARRNREDEEPNIVVKGLFSSKIKCITLKLMELIAQDPNVKVVVFSSWDCALKNLGEALQLNSIRYRLLNLDEPYYKTLIAFKTNTKVNVLLMTLDLAFKKFDLTEATRVFFIEPSVNRVDVDLAISQIHKMGQTKPTFVHHFVFRNSIEENITTIFYGDQPLKFDDITLSQLKALLTQNESIP